MKKRKWWIVGLALSVALLAACVGCNSGSRTAKSPSDSPPKPSVALKEDLPERDAPPWSGSRQFRLSGERFALSSDGWLCLDIEDSVALIELPLRSKGASLSVRTIHLGTNGIQDVAFSPDGKWVAAIEQGWSGPAPVYLINRDPDNGFRQPKLYGEFEIWTDSHALEFSDDSKSIRAVTLGNEPNTIDTFDVKSLGKISSSKTDTPFPRPSPTSPNGQMALTRSSDKARLMVTSGGREIALEAPGMIIHQEHGFLTNDVVAASTDKGLCLWSLNTRMIVAWISYSKKEGALITLADKTVFRYKTLSSLSNDSREILYVAFRELFEPEREP